MTVDIPGCNPTKETGFFTDCAGCNLCIFAKKPGFSVPMRPELC